jgi:hypothetical protein
MPRAMSADMLAALQATELLPAIFVQASFASLTAYIWSGVGTIDWNGQTWTGLGSFLGLSTSEDGVNVEARGITITLSGIDPTLLAEALDDFQLGLPVTVYLGLYSSGSLLDSPLTTWAGRMDQPTIDVTADEAVISINCESRLIDMNVPVDRRYTNIDQQRDFPGDLGFQFVDSLQQKTLFWGNFPNSQNNI